MPKQSKTIRLTDEQVRVFCESLLVIAEATEKGGRVKIRYFKKRVTPAEALRNVVGWMQRKLEEQNGGDRIVMAWDFQEDT